MDQEKSSSSSFEDLANLNENEKNELEKLSKEADNVKEPEEEIMDILGNGQLLKKVIRKGNTDTRPQRHDIVKISYEGKLDDGSVVEEEQNFVLQVGDTEVVQGLDMAIPLMNVGEIAEVVVHPRFAYGDIGLKNEEDPGASVPPESTITYMVELIECKEENDLENKSFDARKEIGNRKRVRGNFWMKRQEYNLAIQSYRRALEYLDETEGGITDPTPTGELEPTNSQLQELLEDRMKVYNNLALAQLKIAAYEAALTSVEHVLKCQPNNAKALFRKGKIVDAKGDTSAAILLLQKAATIDTEDKLVQSELSKLILKSKREARNEKDLYQKMLGHAQKLESKVKPVQATETKEASRFKLWGYLMGTILIGVAGVAIYRYNNNKF